MNALILIALAVILLALRVAYCLGLSRGRKGLDGHTAAEKSPYEKRHEQKR